MMLTPRRRLALLIVVASAIVLTILAFVVPSPTNWTRAPEEREQAVRVDGSVTRQVLSVWPPEFGHHIVYIDNVASKTQTIWSFDAFLHNPWQEKLGLIVTGEEVVHAELRSGTDVISQVDENLGHYWTLKDDTNSYTIVFQHVQPGIYTLTVTAIGQDGTPVADAQQVITVIGK